MNEPRFSGPPSEAEILAHAIARIGELDCTRTLPGRLVWYAEPEPVVVRVPPDPGDPGPVWCEDCHRHRYSVDETGRCFTCRAIANGYVPRSPKTLTPEKAEEETRALFRVLASPADPTRQGGLEAWPNGEPR